MRFVRVISPAAALWFFGAIIPAYAQHDGPDEKQGKKQDESQAKPDKPQVRQDKGTARQQHAAKAERQQPRQQEHQPQQVQRQGATPPAQQHAKHTQQQQRQHATSPQQRPQVAQQLPQPQRTQEQARTWQQQRGWQQGGSWQGQDTWQQDRAQRWSSDHRTWQQRGGYGGSYVPQDRFSISFGSEHFFRIATRPVMYQGYPRFEYSGYSFLLVDPWPEYWSDNWYEYDDVYIDFDDGYYLYNRRYPQVRLAITIAL